MSDLHELLNFVTKFYNLWCSGNDARMELKCEAGKASVDLHLSLPNLPTVPVHHRSHDQQHRQAGPSRLRRRARRAHAWARAATADAATTAEKTAEEEILPDASPAVQAPVPVPATLTRCLASDPHASDQGDTGVGVTAELHEEEHGSHDLEAPVLSHTDDETGKPLTATIDEETKARIEQIFDKAFTRLETNLSVNLGDALTRNIGQAIKSKLEEPPAS